MLQVRNKSKMLLKLKKQNKRATKNKKYTIEKNATRRVEDKAVNT